MRVTSDNNRQELELDQKDLDAISGGVLVSEFSGEQDRKDTDRKTTDNKPGDIVLPEI